MLFAVFAPSATGRTRPASVPQMVELGEAVWRHRRRNPFAEHGRQLTHAHVPTIRGAVRLPAFSEPSTLEARTTVRVLFVDLPPRRMPPRRTAIAMNRSGPRRPMHR